MRKSEAAERLDACDFLPVAKAENGGKEAAPAQPVKIQHPHKNQKVLLYTFNNNEE